MSKKTRIILCSFLSILLLFSLLAVLYPLLSSWYSQQNQSEVFSDYQQVFETKGEEENADIKAAFEAAHEYNRRLAAHEFSPLEYKENGYFDMLNLAGNDIMCFVEIPKINVNLPVYHTTGNDALKKGAGHMEQTSLPVGGPSTHAVISAHTGMASQVMFTDLALMELDDIFYISVMGEKMAYQVDQIKMVLPAQIDDIQIIEDRDLVTLTTCAPYGANTHRLLVRGTRIALDEVEETTPEIHGTEPKAEQPAASLWKEKYIEGILIGLGAAVGILFIVVFIVLLRKHIKKKRERSRD